MKAANQARWTRTKQGWSLIVEIRRHWDDGTPDRPGRGKGAVLLASVAKRGERAQDAKLRLTSNAFRNRAGDLCAFAEEV